MILNKNFKIWVLVLLTGFASCSKLDENLNSTLTAQQTADALGAQGTALLLRTAYADIALPFVNDNEMLANMTANSADESLVPTRAGDWDDNGKWRAMHNHTWNADINAALITFNALNKMNFDATNVLAFKPTDVQAAEARFLRALSLYYLLDLFGQYPFRNPGDNLLNAPEVKTGAAAVDFIIAELTDIIPKLPAANANVNFVANPDAARLLLMRCYLNKGAFINRAAPTFADADMQQVITLGNTIITSGRYSYTANYFDNFSADNTIKTREGIFAYPNTGGATLPNNADMRALWFRTLHYNHYTPKNPNAGWNGFSTVAEFYNTFGIASTPTQTPADTLLDRRIGGRYYAGATNISGLRPGLLIGQQFNETGAKIHYRNWNPATDGPDGKLLIITPAIASNMIETTPGILETTGIRVIKYVPDYPNYDLERGQSNALILFRYPDVVLMVAEAMMRKAAPDNAGALTLVNALRAARGAAALPSMTLVAATNFVPTTLLAERGRELYWEFVRRTDLIRFGVFLRPWPYKPSDDPKNLLFPIPNQALAANPNLKQNPGYN